ncbi:MAG: type IV secretory system conjugative DNA transfer family protein [Mycobacteriales bacterium]
MPDRSAQPLAAASAKLTLLPADHPDRDRPKPLGDADAGPRRGIGLSVPDARHHLHVVGATGTGKSTLLTNLILADATAGRGVAVLDPKGDLITDVLARLPASVGDRLVLIDPAETAAPAAVNVLDTTGRSPELVTDRVVGVFARLYASYWGPRIEDVLRCACLTLTRQPAPTDHGTAATLADIPRLLSQPAYRAGIVARITDTTGLTGFWAWYDGLTEAARAQVIAPVMTKLRGILSRRFAVDLLGATTSTFALADILDGGIMLARLPKGVLGDDTTRLVGSLLLSGLWQAATERATRPETQRLDAAVYVDECHNFMHLPGPLDDVLAEARGYHLSLTLAHQHLGQLPRELADAIHANARNKALFTVSPDDARILARHLGPYLTADDLTRLDRYQLACRLVSGGRDTHGFTLRARPAPSITHDHTGQLRHSARARGRSPDDRRRDLLRPDLYADLAATADAESSGRGETPSVSPSVLASVSPSVPLSALETDRETDAPSRANAHVTGHIEDRWRKPDS